MRTHSRLSCLLAGLALFAACGDDGNANDTADTGPVVTTDAGTDAGKDDLVDRLRAVPGVKSVAEHATAAPGYRAFAIEFVQLVDHAQPDGATFVQRLNLMHREVLAPLVLYTGGYG